MHRTGPRGRAIRRTPPPGLLDAHADAHLRRQAALAGTRPVPVDGPAPPEAIADALGTPLGAVFSGPTRVDARLTSPVPSSLSYKKAPVVCPPPTKPPDRTGPMVVADNHGK